MPRRLRRSTGRPQSIAGTCAICHIFGWAATTNAVGRPVPNPYRGSPDPARALTRYRA